MLGTPLTTMSDLVQRLTRRGLVQKDPHPDDGRSSLLRLSAAGDREWKAGWPALREATEAIVNRLDAPEDDVRAALRRLGAALEQALTET